MNVAMPSPLPNDSKSLWLAILFTNFRAFNLPEQSENPLLLAAGWAEFKSIFTCNIALLKEKTEIDSDVKKAQLVFINYLNRFLDDTLPYVNSRSPALARDLMKQSG